MKKNSNFFLFGNLKIPKILILISLFRLSSSSESFKKQLLAPAKLCETDCTTSWSKGCRCLRKNPAIFSRFGCFKKAIWFIVSNSWNIWERKVENTRCKERELRSGLKLRWSNKSLSRRSEKQVFFKSQVLTKCDNLGQNKHSSSGEFF